MRNISMSEIIWKKNGNILNFSINVRKDFRSIFERYLQHRFRKLVAQSDYFILPINWTYENSNLEIEYSSDSLKQSKNNEFVFLISSEIHFTTLRDNHIIPLLNTVLTCHHQGIFGLFQFAPLYGKIIAPPEFFFAPKPSFYNDQVQTKELREKDAEFLLSWLKFLLDKLENNPSQQESRDSIINVEFVKSLKNALLTKNWNQIENIIGQTSVDESYSFLDFFAQAEFFSKIREIYEFSRFPIEKARKQGIDVYNKEIVLEIRRSYRDLHFGEIKRPSVQEVWDSLIEESRVARELIIIPERKSPNPLIKNVLGALKVEWARVHEDQPLIFIRSKQSAHNFPKRGFLYVYEYGDLDLIQKKRKFLQFVNKNANIQQLITQSSKIEPIVTNLFNRSILVEKIIGNRGLFTVQGPPGTGKTYLATEVVTTLLKRKSQAKCLITAKEHLALNHILQTITKKLKEEKIPFRAYRSLSLQKIKHGKIEEAIEPFLKQNVIQELAEKKWRKSEKDLQSNNMAQYWEKIQNNFIKEADLRNESLAEQAANLFFCTTMDGAINHLLERHSFDLVIVEEAGKCYPTELLHLIPLGQNVLLIGDQNQLPPYQIQQTQEAIHLWEKTLNQARNDFSFKESLIERFGKDVLRLINYFNRYGKISPDKYSWLKPFEQIFNSLPVNKKYVLNEEYRMEKQLSDVIGRVFYNQEFIHKKKPNFPLKGIIPSHLDVPILWIDTPHYLDNPEAGEDPEKIGERMNSYEYKIILKYLQKLSSTSEIDLIIITPYRDQKYFLLEQTELKELVERLTQKTLDQVIKTTDEFQGQEADLTILSLVRNNSLSARGSWGFMTSPQRLNVMFSRTISRQVVIGCSDHIIRNKEDSEVQILMQLFEEYQKEGTIIPAEAFLKDE